MAGWQGSVQTAVGYAFPLSGSLSLSFPRELGSPESEFCITAHIATNKAVGSKAGISELSDRSVE